MKCHLCKKEYEDFSDNPLIITLDGNICKVNKIRYKENDIDLCRDCLRAVLFGVELSDALLYLFDKEYRFTKGVRLINDGEETGGMD